MFRNFLRNNEYIPERYQSLFHHTPLFPDSARSAHNHLSRSENVSCLSGGATLRRDILPQSEDGNPNRRDRNIQIFLKSQTQNAVFQIFGFQKAFFWLLSQLDSSFANDDHCFRFITFYQTIVTVLLFIAFSHCSKSDGLVKSQRLKMMYQTAFLRRASA